MGDRRVQRGAQHPSELTLTLTSNLTVDTPSDPNPNLVLLQLAWSPKGPNREPGPKGPNREPGPLRALIGGTVAQCIALLPHSKKVVGSSPASCNMWGLVPGPFCVEFACSPRVHPGSPHRTPTIKTCKKSRCSSVLTLTKSGPSTWTWSLGAASLAAHCSWLSLGEDARMGKSREHLPPSSLLHVCVCVCHYSYVCAVWL